MIRAIGPDLRLPAAVFCEFFFFLSRIAIGDRTTNHGRHTVRGDRPEVSDQKLNVGEHLNGQPWDTNPTRQRRFARSAAKTWSKPR